MRQCISGDSVDRDVFSRHTGGDKTLSAAALDRTVLIRIAELSFTAL